MTTLLFVEALSPIHAGTGQSAGAVDLPIARERATNYPYIPGSSIKGSLRAIAEGKPEFPTTKLFGPDTQNASDWAGSAAFGDASLLLLPVRSMAGTFALATSALALLRLARDAKVAKLDALHKAAASAAAEAHKLGKDKCLVADQALFATTGNDGKRVVLEDFDLSPDRDPVPGSAAVVLAEALGKELYGATAWATELKKRLCIVHDDLFTYLAEHGTDVVTRVSINRDTNTAKDGQLWTEESLPTATVLVALAEPMFNSAAGLAATQVKGKLKELIDNKPVQLGGKATVGRGRCQITVVGG